MGGDPMPAPVLRKVRGKQSEEVIDKTQPSKTDKQTNEMPSFKKRDKTHSLIVAPRTRGERASSHSLAEYVAW